MALVDWGLAERIGSRLAARPSSLAGELPDLQRDMSAQAPLAEALVTATTGLRADRSGRRAGGRPARVGGGQHRLVPAAARPAAVALEERVGNRAGVANEVTSRVAAVELGSLLGWMSGRVLGQYDLLLSDQPRWRRRLPGRAQPHRAGAALRLPARPVPPLGPPARAHPPGPVHGGAVDGRPLQRPGRAGADGGRAGRPPAGRRGPCAHAGPGRGPPPAGRGRDAGPRRLARAAGHAERDRRDDGPARGPRRRHDGPGRRRPGARRQALLLACCRPAARAAHRRCACCAS